MDRQRDLQFKPKDRDINRVGSSGVWGGVCYFNLFPVPGVKAGRGVTLASLSETNSSYMTNNIHGTCTYINAILCIFSLVLPIIRDV